MKTHSLHVNQEVWLMWKPETGFFFRDSHAPFTWRLPGFLPKLQSVLWSLACWFQWLCTSVFWYLCNSIFSPSVVSFIHEVKLSMHRWQVCPSHLQCTYETKNVVSACKVLFVSPLLCRPAASWGPNLPVTSHFAHVYHTCVYVVFYFLNDVCYFHILEYARGAGGGCLVDSLCYLLT